jgi:hypothetical protein
MEIDDEDDDADENDDADSASDAPALNDKPAQEWSTRKRTDIAKRAHKHAYVSLLALCSVPDSAPGRWK